MNEIIANFRQNEKNRLCSVGGNVRKQYDSYRGDAQEPYSLNLYAYCSNNPGNREDTHLIEAVPIRFSAY